MLSERILDVVVVETELTFVVLVFFEVVVLFFLDVVVLDFIAVVATAFKIGALAFVVVVSFLVVAEFFFKLTCDTNLVSIRLISLFITETISSLFKPLLKKIKSSILAYAKESFLL